MRKLILLIVLLFLITNVFSMLGDGSATSPYVITNCIELQSMKNNLSANYVLLNNIDCYSETRAGGAVSNGGLGFAPIGGESTPFKGTFDGKGYVINGIFISNLSGTYIGLFGNIQDASVKNVGLTGLMITGNGFVGGVVGKSLTSTVSDVYATGQITGRVYVGGIIGHQYAGSTLIHSYFSGNLSGSNYLTSIGGLVGKNQEGVIKNSFASSRITLIVQSGSGYTLQTYVGGITGWNLGGLVENCYWFDPSNRTTKCHYNGNTGCVKASSLSDFYSPTYALYTTSPAWSSDVWTWSGTALPVLKPTYFCYGNILQNSEFFSGDELGLTLADERLSIFSETNTSRKCEFHCKSGFRKVGSKCVDFICNETGINQTNATLCKNDDVNLTKDFNKVLVNFGLCTNSNKCEWECSMNYFVSQDKNSCLPYECLNKPQNAIVCENSDKNLIQNTNSVLVELVSECTQNKCVYYCPQNYFKNGNKCSTWACDGNIDPNAIMYIGENENFSSKEELTNLLVDANTQRKCEWHCKEKFYRDQNKCVPFKCTGVIDSNSIMCSGANQNLDTNKPIMIIDSSDKCAGEGKCEWYCRNGYYPKNGVCLPVSTLTCEGEAILNAEICLDDDVLLTQKGTTNLLVASKDFCSDARKCQWYCKIGYYQGSGMDVNKCLPFSCYGAEYENALLYYKDSEGLDSNTPRNLVDANTSAKCEYFCKSGYHVEIQNGLKKCVINTNFCLGQFENATLFDLDESGLDYNIASVLSKTNTQRKCEWHCDEGYTKIDNNCILIQKNEVACGKANREYLVGEDFPGVDEFCEFGDVSGEVTKLNNLPGSIVSWRCIGDKSVFCTASRIFSSSGDGINSILELTADALNDSNIIISVKCLDDIKLDLNILDYYTGENYKFYPEQIDCNEELASHTLTLIKPPVAETELVIKTSIKNTASDCYTCESNASVSVLGSSSATELNPLYLVGLVVFILIIAFVINMFLGHSEEDENLE